MAVFKPNQKIKTMRIRISIYNKLPFIKLCQQLTSSPNICYVLLISVLCSFEWKRSSNLLVP